MVPEAAGSGIALNELDRMGSKGFRVAEPPFGVMARAGSTSSSAQSTAPPEVSCGFYVAAFLAWCPCWTADSLSAPLILCIILFAFEFHQSFLAHHPHILTLLLLASLIQQYCWICLDETEGDDRGPMIAPCDCAEIAGRLCHQRRV